MTAILVRQLPITLGGALGGASLRLVSWGFERFMRAPFTYLGIASLVGLTAAAGSNAMYWQTMRHPAPIWGAPSVPRADVVPSARPIVLAPVRQTTAAQPAVLPSTLSSPETTGSVSSSVEAEGPSGNARVFEVQKKLAALKLFDGEVDGYYGPRTARAIRAFEEARGMKPQGAMTSDVVQAILAAPVGSVSQRATEPAPVRQPMPAEQLGYAPTSASPMPPLVNGDGTLAAADPQQTASIPSGGDTVSALIAAGEAELPALAAAEPQVQRASMGPASIDAPIIEAPENNDTIVVKIQKGLASLGFLAGTIDGVASDRTAKAIRNFEVFNNFPVSGQITPELVTMLADAGASF